MTKAESSPCSVAVFYSPLQIGAQDVPAHRFLLLKSALESELLVWCSGIVIVLGDIEPGSNLPMDSRTSQNKVYRDREHFCNLFIRKKYATCYARPIYVKGALALGQFQLARFFPHTTGRAESG